MKILKYFIVIVLLCSASMIHAATAGQEAIIEEDVVIAAAPTAAPGGQDLPHKFLFISAEMEHDGKVIAGSPYSAEALTERTQTLADGNRIAHKSKSKVYRDSQGRTRRETEMGAIGNWEASENPPRLVMIHDPVAKMRYVLEPEARTVRKIKTDGLEMLERDRVEAGPKGGKPFERMIHAPGGHMGRKIMQYRLSDKDAKKESLGKQTIEGIVAEGTRTTITIKAGEMGNELPIEIVSEKWYSPELQINLMTKHNDPRFGETVYQLTRISRGEQDRSLFEVPKDYKVDDSPMKHRIIKRHKD